MTNDTKATLLDASHDAYVRLMAAARRSEPHNGYGEADIVSDELTLRAHIAELEAENKRLKAGQLGAVNTDLEGYQFERAQTGEKS